MSNFHVVLKQLRTSKNLTAAQMMELLGVKRRAYFYYESGKNEPSIDQLIQLADLFGVTLDELVGRSHIDSKGS